MQTSRLVRGGRVAEVGEEAGDAVELCDLAGGHKPADRSGIALAEHGERGFGAKTARREKPAIQMGSLRALAARPLLRNLQPLQRRVANLQAVGAALPGGHRSSGAVLGRGSGSGAGIVARQILE